VSRARLALAGLAATAVVTLYVVWRGRGPTERIVLPPPRAVPAAAEPAPEDFTGADACAACHRLQYDAWRRSTHGRAGGPPPPLGPGTLIARFDGRPIRFRDGVVTPSRTSAGQYVFRVAPAGGRAVRVFAVDGVVGGGHMAGGGTQGFVTRFPDGTLRLLPFELIRHERGVVWFCNTNSRLDRGWLPITPELALTDCGDWPPVRVFGDVTRFANCQACHGSRIRTVLTPSRRAYRTEVATLAVDCESCHGPGARHVSLMRAGGATASPDIGLRPLANLAKDQSLEVCFRCHALKDVVRPGYLPGASFVEHYALKFPLLGERPLHADGRVRTFAYQENQLYSDCYLNGSLTCVSCHDPHSQGYREAGGRPLSGRFDDGQCLSCHPSKGDSLEAHTRHARNRPGGRCVDCHMPYLQEPEVGTALRYARSDHTIPIPRPAFDAELGTTSACAGCHTNRSAADLEARVREWYGEVKPHPDVVQALFAATRATDARSAAALLTPETGHRFAQFMGAAEFLQRFLSSDMPSFPRAAEERLRRLAGSDDIDVQALGLASLHLAKGEDPDVRRFLAERLAGLGALDRAVRARWVLALGFIADRHRAAEEYFKAIAVYRKALEVVPDDPAVLRNLGLAYAGAGEAAGAVAYYERSLAADSLQPLTHVNWGIALAQLGDTAGAEARYRRALALDQREALALFNLGNLYLVRGDARRAVDLYRAAIESDGSLALAHFYLGRAYAMLGDRDRAVAAVREGLAFAPEHPIGSELLRTLGSVP
jgi:tetratricopeptide (TPR) repeat protein